MRFILEANRNQIIAVLHTYSLQEDNVELRQFNCMAKSVITLERSAKENLNLIIAEHRKPSGKILKEVEISCVFTIIIKYYQLLLLSSSLLSYIFPLISLLNTIIIINKLIITIIIICLNDFCQEYSCWLDSKGNLSYETFNNQLKEEPVAETNPMELTTFKLSLEDREKESRSRVILPYVKLVLDLLSLFDNFSSGLEVLKASVLNRLRRVSFSLC